ncbi:hypothetical protein H0G86_008496 [Trichoderma simmonsii]|uniref:Glutamyl-tRNA amidotransferase complex subunit Gta3 domain-containing protein n=1 Tax=Trichoderma simmonsii TaxID=1491479 RepID=A0A8G0LHL0_9HYPO|nr:hypothetical protein H0G86_008496 [Trichoderma simmonsii]
MSLCARCRLSCLRQNLRPRQPTATASLSTKSSPSSTAHDILSKPTWSVSSLLPSESHSAPEVITPSQLHHLLRLSALPLPKSPAEEQSMIATLQSQLQFARAVQRVDTKGVEPLRAIRDETEAAVKEMTIGLEDLEEALAKETLVGHYQRPRRAKERIESDAENWDALATASRKAGKYFVVESGKKAEAGEP